MFYFCEYTTYVVLDVSNGLEEQAMKCPWKFDPLLALEVLEKFFLFSANGEAVQVDCLKIEQTIDKHFTKNKKQTTIKDIFLIVILIWCTNTCFSVFKYFFSCLFTEFVQFLYLWLFWIFAISNKIFGPLRVRNKGLLVYNFQVLLKIFLIIFYWDTL